MHKPGQSVFCLLIALLLCWVTCPEVGEAARPRRPSAAQIKQKQEQMKYLQQEMIRYQTEVAAKEREVFKSFDENGNGHLEGGEKARFDKYMHAVQKGTEPNPLATITPIGKGPKDSKPSGSDKDKK
jgi:hypothetical protein